MSSRIEHYREAERLLATGRDIARAQVHATLAAATDDAERYRQRTETAREDTTRGWVRIHNAYTEAGARQRDQIVDVITSMCISGTHPPEDVASAVLVALLNPTQEATHG